MRPWHVNGCSGFRFRAVDCSGMMTSNDPGGIPMATVQNEAQQAFTAKMAEKHITPLWTISKNIFRREPTPVIPPVYWNYKTDVRPYILEATDLITAAEAHRRVLVLN